MKFAGARHETRAPLHQFPCFGEVPYESSAARAYLTAARVLNIDSMGNVSTNYEQILGPVYVPPCLVFAEATISSRAGCGLQEPLRRASG